MNSLDHWQRPTPPDSSSSFRDEAVPADDWQRPDAPSQTSSSRPAWDQAAAMDASNSGSDAPSGGAAMPTEFRRPSTANGSNEQALREGFTRGRVVWFGSTDSWREDWWFYVANEHTLISICRGHAMHHFERFDRICYLCCVICFTLFLSALVQNKHPPHNGLVEYGVYITLASIALVAYDALLRFMATCPCIQPGGCLHGACWLCRDCCIDAGKQGLYIVSICSFGFLIAGIVLAATADVDPGMYFFTFMLMRVGNYLAEFAPLGYYFYSRREKQKPYWLDNEVGGAYPYGFGLPDPIYVRDTRYAKQSEGYWPGEDVENPLARRSSKSLRAKRAESSAARQRKIELLERARAQVRGDVAARKPGASAPRTRTPPRDDALGAFGRR